MSQVLLVPENWAFRGSALRIVVKMLEHFYDVKPTIYTGATSGIFLGYNKIPRDLHPAIACNLLMGGGPIKYNGLMHRQHWHKVRWLIFNSRFLQRIIQSQFSNLGSNTVLHILGGVCSDDNLFSWESKIKSLRKSIKFLVCAKWWKRNFKRKTQYIRLFREHILPEYPQSQLYVLGHGKTMRRKKIHFIQRDFSSQLYANLYRECHIHLMFSPFDTGPLTLTESLHYRLPFVCSNNCCGEELIKRVSGKCGEMVITDPQIRSVRDCRRYRPMTSEKFYNKFDYVKAMNGIRKVISSYPEYVQWKWTDTFNYANQASKWMELLYG